MFDIGFSELLMFGVIALIVLGPEKLPQAARTAGQWYSKIRRTVSTLQSEIEAELDLAETRQQMQKELAKIRQTEENMKREMEQLRGSMQEFESSQNQSLKGEPQKALDLDKQHTNDASNRPDVDTESMPATSLDLDYTYHQDSVTNTSSTADSDHLIENATNIPTLTRPWENMWFRLGAYDKNRRLPAPPYLPNYKADTLLYTQENDPSLASPRSTL